MYYAGIIKFADPEALVGNLTCNNGNPDCMLGNCKECKDNNLKSNEIILHIDFSENDVAKSFEEIQSVHFGASK